MLEIPIALWLGVATVAASPVDSAALAAPRAGAPVDTAREANIARPTLDPSSSGVVRGGSSDWLHSVDYMWVLRDALLSRKSIDSVVARATRTGVRGILVQVVGRGDAFYRSDLLPRAEALSLREPDYDPLHEILLRAHGAGLEVHAWMNCMLVWSAPYRPRDARHVLNAHPEWVAVMRDGRSMARIKERERRRLGVEGVYLAPAHPGVRAWLVSIAMDIAQRYPVDGIHLDYIRQPDIPVGYDPTTRARFALASGVDPQRFDRVHPEERAAVDSAWRAFQREQVTSIVREVHDSLRVVRPGLQLTAAVIADTLRAERANAQSWRAWIKTGLLDRAFPMTYAPSVQVVMDQLLTFAKEFGTTDRVIPGLAVFNTSAATAAIKIKGARALGYPLLALYSYDSLFASPALWSRLRDRLLPPPELLP